MSRTSRWFACALCLCAATPALARPPVDPPDNLLNDRFSIGGDFTFSSSSTQLRVDSSKGVLGTPLDGESDLGLPSRKIIGALDVMFRTGERHTFRLDYLFLPLDRSGTATLTKTVNFKDGTYNPGDVVSSDLNIRLEGINYAYSVLKSERYEFGVSLGVDLIEVAADAEVPARLVQQHQELSAPVPLLGLDGTYRFSARWYGQADWQYLRATVNHIHGAADFWRIGALYRVNPHVTLGLGYRSYDVNVDSRKPGDTGQFSIKTTGPNLYGAVGF